MNREELKIFRELRASKARGVELVRKMMRTYERDEYLRLSKELRENAEEQILLRNKLNQR